MIALLLALQLVLGDVRVVDGDTLDGGSVRYRVAALDAPSPRSRCPRERAAAQRATAEVERLVAGARRIEVFPTGDVQPETDRYRARVIARVSIDGEDLTDHMIEAGLGRPWPNDRSWC